MIGDVGELRREAAAGEKGGARMARGAVREVVIATSAGSHASSPRRLRGPPLRRNLRLRGTSIKAIHRWSSGIVDNIM